jgi:hypothetical protein
MLTLCQIAGMLPRDPKFRQWLSTAAEVEGLSADEAAEIVRTVCQISSRRELANNAEAARRFNNLLRRPFVAWRAKQH